jgi:hypothetical protein
MIFVGMFLMFSFIKFKIAFANETVLFKISIQKPLLKQRALKQGIPAVIFLILKTSRINLC